MLTNYVAELKSAVETDVPLKMMLFSDSKIALAWIQGDDSRWNTFVANRVKAIKKETLVGDWHYVNTKMNPADLASRGVEPSNMTDSPEAKLWFNGPAFVHCPIIKTEESEFSTMIDEKKIIKVAAIILSNEFTDVMRRISTWTGTVRTFAYVLRLRDRAINMRARKEDPQTNKLRWDERLRVHELRRAQESVLIFQQEESYKTEMSLLKAGKKVHDGRLKALTPFLDKAGIMRVGGRLDKSVFIPYNERHPVILPKMEVPADSRKDVVETRDLTRKIIDWESKNNHLSCLHGGERKTLAVLQQKFHIPNARSAVRFVIHRCVQKIRNRFESTKGLPKTVLSDNATTFKKAHKMLKEDEKKAYEISMIAIREAEKEIQAQYAFRLVEVFTNEEGLMWKFLPPLAPYFGGKHEACVKQIKITLNKTLGLQQVPLMVFLTFCKQAEAMYNSRPLCIAFERDMVLTPAHFWLGRPLTALPEPDYLEANNLVTWREKQINMTQKLWKMWKSMVVNQLIQSPKWTEAHPNVEVGEIVLMKEDNTPPMVWRKARVVETYPGNDDFVRVVLVNDAKLPVVVGNGEQKASFAVGCT